MFKGSDGSKRTIFATVTFKMKDGKSMSTHATLNNDAMELFWAKKLDAVSVLDAEGVTVAFSTLPRKARSKQATQGSPDVGK